MTTLTLEFLRNNDACDEGLSNLIDALDDAGLQPTEDIPFTVLFSHHVCYADVCWLENALDTIHTRFRYSESFLGGAKRPLTVIYSLHPQWTYEMQEYCAKYPLILAMESL